MTPETAGIDQEGNAVHEECYAAKFAGVMIEQPQLVITSSSEDLMLSGHCSACLAAQFRIRGNTLKDQQRMRETFGRHFKRVHMKDKSAYMTI
jgi:hypothetical protein